MKRKKCRFICVLLVLAMLMCMAPATAVQAAEAREGQFTVCSMNVDGLPNKIFGIPINSDGPGSAGTKAISAKMAEFGWDIIGVSEDFNYNTELLSALTNYKSGTHRGGVSGLWNNTDGLNLIWKNTFTTTGEKWTSWNTHYSTGPFGAGNGADGMIDKGYRYYQVTVADGVAVDVYILHMDADSDARDIDARESQLTQLADAIKASDNKNPIIVMGDTNCRYTRENLKTLFIDAINADSRFTIQDAWIELIRQGSYPVYGSDAIVAKDKGGSYDYPEAEIVDKVFYINNSDSKVTISADSYKIATDFVNANGSALADHWPVVVQFTYSVAAPHVHSYVSKVTKAATCEETGVRTYTCEGCGDSYTETIPAAGHSYVSAVTKEATCEETGVRTYTCENCGDSYTETIPAAGHSYVSAVTKEATCEETGVRTYTCENCGDSYTETIPAAGHSYVGAVTKEATCEETGVRTYTCEGCGDSYTETIPAAGHSYVGAVTKEATCEETGVRTYTCENCGDSYTEIIPATGHNYVNGVCTNCGERTAVEGTMVLGEETKTITSGKKYVVVFSGSSGNFSMNHTGTTIENQAFALTQGSSVDESYIWTITEKNGKYVFSTEIDGQEYYLYRTGSFTGSGYKIGLTTNADKATAWTASTSNSLGTLRFYVKSGFASFYLRYHNAKVGWQASFSAAGVHLYEVVEG